MTIQELFVRSNQELREVVDHITDQWDVQLPPGMSSKPTTLHGAVNYHAYDDAWVPDVLDGKTKEEVGGKFESILTTDKAETLTVYDRYNTFATKKVQNYEDLDKIVHLSYGDFSAHDYLQHIIAFRAFRTYDIAKLIGADTKMADDWVQALWDEYTPLIEGYRQMGVFPPALEVPEDADLQTKLLGLVGRS